MNHTAIAPTQPISTTQRHPSRPNGVTGTSFHARNARHGTHVYCTACMNAYARPRMLAGTSSDTYESIVTSSAPTPIPAITRQNTIAYGLVWNDMIAAQIVYHSSATTKIRRRPYLSAANATQNVPMKSPRNNAPTKAPRPVRSKNEAVVFVKMPALTSPGLTYAVRNMS